MKIIRTTGLKNFFEASKQDVILFDILFITMKFLKNNLFFTAVFFVFLVSPELDAQEPEMFRIAGFAAEGGNTTGGSGGDTVTVTTGIELQDALNAKKDSPDPLLIYVEGTINLANSGDLSKIDIKDIRDVSVIGAGEGAEFDGIGIKIFKAGNIIVRNLKVHHVLSGEKDCISIEGPADHIWVDHCELYNEYQGVDKDYYDGLLDAKAEAEYITYSWNFLHDSWKTALVGSSESDIFDRKLTMHHNYFLNCNSRLPLFRASTGHFFNNYFKDIASTTINTRINSCVRIENNYFENANNPWVSAYSDVLGGGEATGNILINSPFVYSGDTHEMTECSPVIPYEYSNLLHAAESVPGLVVAFSGTGKIDIGPDPVYTLVLSNTGEGSIIADPQKPYYDSADVVTLTAIPDTDWDFSGWSGSLTGMENPVSITMDENKMISAAFTTTKVFLEYNSSGPGTVIVEPDRTAYDEGEQITLTAVPDEGAQFQGWTGDITGSENPASFTIDSNMQVTAIFIYEPSDFLELQFEEVYCQFDGTVETEHAGYTGSGFIDFLNETGSGITIAINATEMVSCTAGIRYAHGKTDDRSMEVTVNGIPVIADLDFPTTGAFTTWDTVTATFDLATGNNLVRFTALTSNGGPNFDMIHISTSNEVVSPGNCSEEPVTINPPTSLTASVISDHQVDLDWIDNSSDESGFILERKESTGSFTEIADLDQNTVIYQDESLEGGKTYTYRVRAYNEKSESFWSNTVTVTTYPTAVKDSYGTVAFLNIYPNPLKEMGIIDFGTSAPGPVRIGLISMDGRRLVLYDSYNNMLTRQSVSFSTKDLVPGLYLVEMISGSERVVTRIMITK